MVRDYDVGQAWLMSSSIRYFPLQICAYTISQHSTLMPWHVFLPMYCSVFDLIGLKFLPVYLLELLARVLLCFIKVTSSCQLCLSAMKRRWRLAEIIHLSNTIHISGQSHVTLMHANIMDFPKNIPL